MTEAEIAAEMDAQFDTRPTEIRRFLKGKLDLDRTAELTDAMRSAGLPL